MATPWSAPAWMKTNGSLVGGELIDGDRHYDAYARFVRAYEGAGVPIDALTSQNEPQNRNPDVPGMHLGVAQAKHLIQALGPELRRAGPATRIVAFDHNWAIHPNDVVSTPPGQDPEIDYARDVLSDPDTARWVAGVAYHCYYGDPSAQSRLHDRFPDKDVYFTECSGSRRPTDTPRWHARNVVIGTTRNGDGAIALLLHNEGDEPHTVDVSWRGHAVACALPGGSLATLAWQDTVVL